MDQLEIVILAAGAGTRMKSPTPKVLHVLCGREMLFYIIREAQMLTPHVTVVLYHEAARVQETMERHFTNVRFAIQDHANYPGTGGALMNLPFTQRKILVLNGDMPLVKADSLRQLCESDASLTMSTIRLENPQGYGRVVINQGSVQKIVEEKDASDAEKAICTVNAGVYCFDKELLTRYLPKLNNQNQQQEYYLTDIIGLAKEDAQQIRAVEVAQQEFSGVNDKSQLAAAESILANRIRQRWMREGVIMRLPETIYIEDTVTFTGECTIENGCTILGDSHINSSHIKAHSVIESGVLQNSSVGPMARIRPGSRLIDTHIGNFVETKKAELTGVKAGHLSYLGDCTIKEGTNIGAGTITCNYDGKAKHRTTIGKNVFIGSDTQLVAPVRVADNVLIAAGTTVTKDIATGELAISRTPQTNKSGFFERFFGKKN